jgi:DNA polymerase III subunit epsilon
MKTIAIDFETANPDPGNACQIGLAWIEGGRVSRVEERLIRPRELRFTFTWVHGIADEHVRGAPEFPEVLAEFRADLAGALVLAHNAPFDAGVMRGCARAYGLRLPRMTYLCTLAIARQVWPQLKSKALPSVAAHLGVGFTHHNAAEDARACAEIALAAARITGALEIADLSRRLETWRPPSPGSPDQDSAPAPGWTGAPP